MVAFLLTLFLAAVHSAYTFNSVCISSFAESLGSFCIVADNSVDNSNFTFVMPQSVAGVAFVLNSESGDTLLFGGPDPSSQSSLGISCLQLKGAVTYAEAATDPGVRLSFLLNCIQVNGASLVTVTNLVHDITVSRITTISFMPPVEDWYAEFLLYYNATSVLED